ncbi:MAG: formylglycine-generating enzyme family protein [Candidatus Coatesbacteria bacterium]|nr:formylglycine-generating enzyme family protein [Candidatus Coatesbacteria bacterium]
MRYSVLVFVCILCLAALASAEPTIMIETDSDTYEYGDRIEVSLSAQNPGTDLSVSVLVGLLTPDSAIWTLSPYAVNGWNETIEAWIPEIYVPAAFHMQSTPFFAFYLPLTNPPLMDLGEYSFAAVLTRAGDSEWLCNVSLASFEMVDSEEPTVITMVEIPAGSFLMGSSLDDEERDGDERPQRTVNLSAFSISRTEVTEKQWEDVMGWNPCYYSLGDDHPVEFVTWFDCIDFCNKLSESEGLGKCYRITDILYNGDHIVAASVTCDFAENGYRLPTEAEWEYACRAGTTTRYYTGDSEEDLSREGWYDGNSIFRKHEVVHKEANAWGLYDMHGNVYEWCWDWHSLDYYGSRPDPDSDPKGPDSGSYRVCRGGAWDFSARYCRSADRYSFSPNYSNSDLGLRLVRSIAH